MLIPGFIPVSILAFVPKPAEAVVEVRLFRFDDDYWFVVLRMAAGWDGARLFLRAAAASQAD